MTTLTFPTRPGWIGKGRTTAPGTPRRAQPCRCDRPLVLVEPYQPKGVSTPIMRPDTCALCGRFPRSTVDRTWAARAAQLALPVRAERKQLAA